MQGFVAGVLLTLLGVWLYQSDNFLAQKVRGKIMAEVQETTGLDLNNTEKDLLELRDSIDQKIDELQAELESKKDLGEEKIEKITTLLQKARDAINQINESLEILKQSAEIITQPLGPAE